MGTGPFTEPVAVAVAFAEVEVGTEEEELEFWRAARLLVGSASAGAEDVIEGSASVVVVLLSAPVVEFPPDAANVKVTTDPGRPGLTVREAKGVKGCAPLDEGHDDTYGVARVSTCRGVRGVYRHWELMRVDIIYK